MTAILLALLPMTIGWVILLIVTIRSRDPFYLLKPVSPGPNRRLAFVGLALILLSMVLYGVVASIMED